MNHRKSPLTAAIVSCLALSFSAVAQDAKPDATELDRVVVTGIRASLQQSLETKRNADAIVDVITAEDVGKFPATNVAEAMTLIPGIAIDRAFGQGERVSILGTDPSLNRTFLNGQTIASGDWNMSDFPTRTFNYSLLAPQLVGKVEVFKSPEARLDEGSIGGSVMISTRKPLDLDRPLTISGQVGVTRNEVASSTDPNAALLLGWKNQAENFGVVLSAQRDEENIRREGFESFNVITASAFNASIANGNCAGACADTIRANPNAIGVNSAGAAFFEQERKRDTYTLNLQAKPVDKLDIEFNAFAIDASYDHQAHPMFINPGNNFNSADKLTDITIKDGIVTGGKMKNALSIFDLQSRWATTKSRTYDLKAAWNDERWSASAQLGTTRADAGPRQFYSEFLARTDYAWQVKDSDSNPFEVSFPNGNPFNDPSLFRFEGWAGNVVEKPTVDKEKYGQVDFGLKLDSPVYLLRFGYKQRDHFVGQVQKGFALNTPATNNAGEFGPRPMPGDYLSGMGNGGALSDRFTVDPKKLYDWIMSGAWLAPGTSMPTLSPFNSGEFARNTWSIEEDSKAAYAQADFSIDRLRGNVGIRYVRTETVNEGYTCANNLNPCPQWETIVEGKKYNSTLPNLNLIYDLNEDMVLRFSAAKVIARPNYADMSSYIWLTDLNLSGAGGNPDLDPYKSTNFDFSAEWYMSENAILAASVFYRDVKDYILNQSQKESHYNINQNRTDIYDVTRPQNAGNAKVRGYSLAWQQNLGLGFGIVANYTFSDGEADDGRPLPFNSEHQFNISPYFEQGNWSARLTYGWRDKYFTRMAAANTQVWTDDYGSLDASFGYRVNDNLAIQLNAMNLLNENYRSYFGNKALTNGLYTTGRRYMASLRFDF